MTSKELLMSIQLYGRKVTSNNEFLEELKSFPFFSKSVLDYTYATHERLPTDYQNSHFYCMIEDAFSVLKETIEHVEIQFQDRTLCPKPIPLFGTTNLDAINAFVETSDNASVIVFNEGLLKLVQRLKEIYTKEQWLIKHRQLTPRLSELLTRNFFDIMLCFYLYSDAYGAIPLDWCEADDLNDLASADKIYKLSSSFEGFFSEIAYLQFEQEMTTSSYLWIAAHEYAHVVLGHLEEDNQKSALYLNDVQVSKIDFDYQKELDADLLGAIIAMESHASFFAFSGIYFVLTCLLLSEICNETNGSEDHPPVEMRIRNILDHITQNKKYPVGCYGSIDRIFAPKLQAFNTMLAKTDTDKITFSSRIEMQEYVYKVYAFD